MVSFFQTECRDRFLNFIFLTIGMKPMGFGISMHAHKKEMNND